RSSSEPMAERSWNLRALRRPLIGVAVVALLAAVAYVWHLGYVVSRQFEGRRWTLPAQVYAAPLELYVGLPLSAAQLEEELTRLKYRRTSTLTRSGTYQRRGSTLEVWLRAARFADEQRPAQRLIINTRGRSITSLRNAQGE